MSEKVSKELEVTYHQRSDKVVAKTAAEWSDFPPSCLGHIQKNAIRIIHSLGSKFKWIRGGGFSRLASMSGSLFHLQPRSLLVLVSMGGSFLRPLRRSPGKNHPWTNTSVGGNF